MLVPGAIMTGVSLWVVARLTTTFDAPFLIACAAPSCLFFFSSRRRHTRLQGDWSSDVCSSDLNESAWRHSPEAVFARPPALADRKSTRLNSSHLVISYAVFCLKKRRKTVGEAKIERAALRPGVEAYLWCHI